MTHRARPACGAQAFETIERVGLDSLIDSYRKKGIDVTPYFGDGAVTTLYRCTACDLGFFSPAPPGDGGFYAQLQTQDWYYQDAKPEYRYAAARVPAHAEVLEVGCGKGAFRAFLPASAAYTGLEFNDEAVRKARAQGLDVIKQPVEEHAAAGRRYDVVCAFQVLEHVARPGAFFHACVQALKPGGKVIVAVPAQDSFLAVAANAPLNMPPHHLTRWSDRALRNLARREALDRIELWHEPVADFHRDWHETTLALYALSRLGLFKRRLLDDSLGYRIAGRLARARSLRAWLAGRAVRQQPEYGAGHTVVMVAQHA